jgi:hypothetical protein
LADGRPSKGVNRITITTGSASERSGGESPHPRFLMFRDCPSGAAGQSRNINTGRFEVGFRPLESNGRFLSVGRDNPKFHLAVDIRGELNLDRIEPELFERAFDPDVLRLNREVLIPERFGNLIGVD